MLHLANNITKTLRRASQKRLFADRLVKPNSILDSAPPLYEDLNWKVLLSMNAATGSNALVSYCVCPICVTFSL